MNYVTSDFEKINNTFEEYLIKIRRLVDHDFCDEAIILTVTISEVYLKELFKMHNSYWFAYENTNRIERRFKIYDYMTLIRARDDFIQNNYVYQLEKPDPELAAIYHTLFKKGGRSQINFQNLSNDSNSVKKAYKLFYDVDLVKMFGADKESSKKNFESTRDLFEERHKIIHDGKNTAFTKDDIETVISSLENLKSELPKKLGGLLVGLDSIADNQSTQKKNPFEF